MGILRSDARGRGKNQTEKPNLTRSGKEPERMVEEVARGADGVCVGTGSREVRKRWVKVLASEKGWKGQQSATGLLSGLEGVAWTSPGAERARPSRRRHLGCAQNGVEAVAALDMYVATMVRQVAEEMSGEERLRARAVQAERCFANPLQRLEASPTGERE